MFNLSLSNIKALAYHHVFTFPLTPFEVYKYSPSDPNKNTDDESHHIDSKIIITKNGLQGLLWWNQTDIELKRKRSWQMITYAQTWFVKYAPYIPTIEYIGVTGSTAALNASPHSDIDILVVTKAQTGWLTRVVLLSVLTIFRKRTHTQKNNNSYTFCTNIILENSNLSFGKQDLFTAMELAHMKPIYNKNHSYERLLQKNMWIQQYLPHFWELVTREWNLKNLPKPNSPQTPLIFVGLNEVSKLFQQFVYKAKNKMNLTLSNTWVKDHRYIILESYEDILNTLKKENSK